MKPNKQRTGKRSVEGWMFVEWFSEWPDKPFPDVKVHKNRPAITDFVRVRITELPPNPTKK